MKKLALCLMLVVCSCVVGLALMAPEPTNANAAVNVQVPAVPALDTPPVVVETGAVLHITPAKKEAPKARPAPARPQLAAKGRVDCSNAKHRDVEQTALGTTVRYCHN